MNATAIAARFISFITTSYYTRNGGNVKPNKWNTNQKKN